LWTDQDRVGEVMTDVGAATAVAPAVRCDQADRVADREGVHHLLVVDGDTVIGTICRCRLAPGHDGDAVATRLMPALWTVAPDTTLGKVVEAMEQHGVSILAIAEEGRLLGVVTRSDLGMSEHGAGLASDCAACDGSSVRSPR
jgi:CBS domain-containing protein